MNGRRKFRPTRSRLPLGGGGPALVETTRDEMQAYYDERSAAWQEGERAASLLDAIEQLDALLSDVDDLPSF